MSNMNWETCVVIVVAILCGTYIVKIMIDN